MKIRKIYLTEDKCNEGSNNLNLIRPIDGQILDDNNNVDK